MLEKKIIENQCIIFRNMIIFGLWLPKFWWIFDFHNMFQIWSDADLDLIPSFQKWSLIMIWSHTLDQVKSDQISSESDYIFQVKLNNAYKWKIRYFPKIRLIVITYPCWIPIYAKNRFCFIICWISCPLYQ